MTNHCPQPPAEIRIPLGHDKVIEDFARGIMDKMMEFAEEQSMDNMIILDSGILDSWTECPRCESLICETQGKAYSLVIRQIMAFLNSEF